MFCLTRSNQYMLMMFSLFSSEHKLLLFYKMFLGECGTHVFYKCILFTIFLTLLQNTKLYEKMIQHWTLKLHIINMNVALSMRKVKIKGW
jgi:hypothetical protein